MQPLLGSKRYRGDDKQRRGQSGEGGEGRR